MVEVTIKDQTFDEKTSASCGRLEIGKVKSIVPNKFATTSELNASRLIDFKGLLPSEVIVSAKLMFPNTLKKLLSEEQPLKDFARRLSRETAGAEEFARVMFLCFRGEAGIERAEDLRTILDLQYFSDFDLITVQQSRGVSAEDFSSLFSFASRWREERGLEKPLMPVISAAENRQDFERCIEPLVKRGISCLGVDMRGGFYYHSLRALEDLKKSNPKLWIHVFQVPPKIKFARRLLPCSEGMMLPYFGVDSFSRWVVPPPPEPLTKDKINLFDRVGWGVFKRKELSGIRGKRLGCDCPICKGLNLESFFYGRVLTALSRSKVHDHFAQQIELKESFKHIKERTYLKFVTSKEFARKFLDTVKKA